MFNPINKDLMDIEVVTLSDMLEKGMWAPHEVAHIQRQLEDRKAQIASGLGSMTQLYWTLKVQKEVDSHSRVRRDPAYGWMLDRYIDEVGCWQPIGYIGDGGKLEIVTDADIPSFSRAQEDGNVQCLRVIDDKIRPDLIFYLQSHDMQRPGYLKDKADRAVAVRKANEEASTNKVLAAVDSMSSKQIKEFVEVEKAIQTGETVTMHGETMRQFEKMTEAGKKAPEGTPSINPGLHPQIHKRDYSEGEGERYGKRKGA
jgi:hypothetical protein